MRTPAVLGLAVLWLAASGCQKDPSTYPRTYAPQAATSGPGAPDEAPRAYDDGCLTFDRPPGWSAVPGDEKDPNIHAVNLKSPEGLFVRITLVRTSADPGAFPFEVTQGLRRANPTLAAEPHTASLAGAEARGYRYTFSINDAPFEGLVVSQVKERSELCFLGQYAASTPAEQRERLIQVMKSLRMKSPSPGGKPSTP